MRINAPVISTNQLMYQSNGSNDRLTDFAMLYKEARERTEPAPDSYQVLYKGKEAVQSPGDNPLGLTDEEYDAYFCVAEFDENGKKAYFPPKNSPVEVQQAWYDNLKNLSILEVNFFHADLYSSLVESSGIDYSDMSADILNGYIQGNGLYGTINKVCDYFNENLALNAKGNDTRNYLVEIRSAELFNSFIESL